MKKVMYFVLALALTVGISSCEGPEGPAGTNGQDGTNGTDGNANAQTYVFNNPSWGSQYWMDINMDGILTDDVIQNNVILGYVKPTNYNLVSPVPGEIAALHHQQIKIYIFDSNNSFPFTYRLVSEKLDGTPTPHANLQALAWVKVIIIASTNTTTVTGNGRMANVSPKEAVQQELAAANVDINDYYAVCAYYGIDPK